MIKYTATVLLIMAVSLLGVAMGNAVLIALCLLGYYVNDYIWGDI
jgi:hypothetical protein